VNVREAAALFFGVALWGGSASGGRLRLFVDNKTVFFGLLRGASVSPWVYFFISAVFSLQAVFRFALEVTWVPTDVNAHADSLSRGMSPAPGFRLCPIPPAIRFSGFGVQCSGHEAGSKVVYRAVPPRSHGGASMWRRKWALDVVPTSLIAVDVSVPVLSWVSSCTCGDDAQAICQRPR
jgi:hypothetical protein